MNSWEEKLRATRAVHAMFLVTVPFYAATAEFVAPNEPREFAVFRLAFFVASAVTAVLGFQIRAKMIPVAEDVLRRNPGEPNAAQSWYTAHFLSFVAAEAIALFGLVLRFVGGTLLESLPFYIVGLGLLLAWMPRRPS